MSTPISATQPQIAQFEIQFAGPLTTDQQVESVNDLLLLKSDYNYIHKLVWVKQAKTFYYIVAGNGTDIANWQKFTVKAGITRYDTESSYEQGESVYLSGKIYTALQNVPIQRSPLSYESYWLLISGEANTKRFLFQNASSVIVYTEIRNPIFQIMLGDFEYDSEGLISIDSNTGLAIINNVKYVEAFVKLREDLLENNGIPYEISFFENDAPKEMLSGCINVK